MFFILNKNIYITGSIFMYIYLLQIVLIYVSVHRSSVQTQRGVVTGVCVAP